MNIFGKRYEPAVPPVTDEEKRAYLDRNTEYNFKVTTVEGIFASFSLNLVAPFFGVLAVALGASNTLLAFLTSLPALINTLTLIPGARYGEKKVLKRPTISRTAMIGRALYLLMAFIPFLPLGGAQIFLFLVAIQTIPLALSGLVWTALVGDIFPREKRGSIFGLRNVFTGIAGFVATKIAGNILDSVPYPYNFMTVFLMAFVTGQIAARLIYKMIEVERHPAVKEREPSFLQRIKAPFKDKKYGADFTKLALSSFIVYIGIFIVAPIFTIYHVRELHLSNVVIANLAVGSSIAAVAAHMLWGRLIERRGCRFVFITCVVGLSAALLIYPLSTAPFYLIMCHALTAFFFAGFTLSVFNLILDFSSRENHMNATAVFNSTMNMAGFVAPFIGAALYNYIGSINMFYLSGIIRLLGLAALLGLINPMDFIRDSKPWMRRMVQKAVSGGIAGEADSGDYKK